MYLHFMALIWRIPPSPSPSPLAPLQGRSTMDSPGVLTPKLFSSIFVWLSSYSLVRAWNNLNNLLTSNDLIILKWCSLQLFKYAWRRGLQILAFLLYRLYTFQRKVKFSDSVNLYNFNVVMLAILRLLLNKRDILLAIHNFSELKLSKFDPR